MRWAFGRCGSPTSTGGVSRRGGVRVELPGDGGKRCSAADVDGRIGPRRAAAVGQGGAGELGSRLSAYRRPAPRGGPQPRTRAGGAVRGAGLGDPAAGRAECDRPELDGSAPGRGRRTCRPDPGVHHPMTTNGSGMTIVRTVAELRAALHPYRAAGSVGLVPTMGALHDGHLQLARRAKAENDVVVMSIFVNPTQFNDPADLNAYPRDEQADAELAASADVDLLFMPSATEVYPPGFSATVQLHGPIVETLEGARRGVGHFQGVTTVVSKLLGMAQPDRAYFGQKDAQQARVVRALVADLNIGTQIVTVPTVREPDGLAMS